MGAIVLQLSGILLLPLYTHYLDAAEYGILQVVYRIGEVFHVCLMVQAIKLATFNLAGSSETAGQRVRTGASVALVTVISVVIGATAIVLVGPSLDRLLSINDPRFLVCGVLTLMLQAGTVMPLTMMQSRFESVPYVWATVGIATCHVAITSFVVAVLGWGIWGVIFSLALTYGTFGIVLTLRELVRSSFQPDRDLIRRFVRFATPMVPVGILSIAMHNGDQIFLMKYHGSAVVGVYALAYRVTQALEMFATEPFFQIWHAWIYKVFRRDDGRVALGRAATRIISVYTFAGLGLVILRQEAITLLSSPTYWEATELIPPLILAFFFLVASGLIDASFFVTSRTARRTVISLASAAIMMTLYVVLIPRYGATGAAYSTLLGFAANFLITLAVAQHAFRIEYEYGRLAWVLGTALIVAWLASLCGNGITWVLPKVVIWLSWPVLIWTSGLMSGEEKQLVTGFVWRSGKST